MAALDLRRMRAQGKKAFDGFTNGQKAMVAVAVGAVVVGMFLFTRAQGGVPMATLFGNLDPADASEITASLEAQRVPYELVDNGRAVLVPRDRVYQLRVDLSAEGLPKGGKGGWSLIDQQGITTSQFRQRVDYQRALEGELARTIAAFDSVETATVHLVIPSDDVFAADRKKSTASVLVATRRGVRLDQVQVQSIVNLVAGSVPELATGNVTVTDSTGALLWAPGMEDGLLAADIAVRQRAEFEAAMARDVEGLLAAITGPGKVRVKVAADLDFDKRASESTRYEAPQTADGDPLLQQSTSSSEQYTGSGDTTVGALGVDGQPLANAGDAVNGTGGNQYQRTDQQSVFANNVVVERIDGSSPRVNRLGISVVVDEAAVPAARVAALQEALLPLVDAERGDTVSIQRLPFDTTAAEQAQQALDEARAAAGSGSVLGSIVRLAGPLALVLVVLLAAWRSLRKAAKQATVSEPLDLRELEAVRDELRELVGPSGATGAELTGGGAGAADGGELEARDQPFALPPVPVPEAAKKVELIEAEISEVVERQPQEVAVLLRTWLAERRTVRR